MKEIIFYVLTDPRTHEPRYVGKTVSSIDKRIYLHCYKESDIASSQWIHELVKQELKPVGHELERVMHPEDSRPIERFWVQYFRFLGADLTNSQYNYKGRPRSQQ